MIFAVSLDQADADLSQDNKIRVGVLVGVDQFELSIRGRYKMTDPLTNSELDSGRKLTKSLVTLAQQGIKIAEQVFPVKHLRIIAKKDATIYREGRGYRYRGQIDIIHDKNDKMLVVNTVDMEAYVKGVLYHEVPHTWPLNAIKAQAITTRTYALYQWGQRKEELYDVTSTIYSQVYGGRSAERHRSNIAANRTRGQILTHQGEVLPAYFHSTCGGTTENAKAIWKHDLLPIRGKTCSFCTKSPHYRWTKNFRSKDIQDQLNSHGFNLGLIENIEAISRTKSGRIDKLKITARDGKVVTIPGIRFREIIGPNRLKSNHYEIDMQGYYFDAMGRGWGHGVGMCQWGAYQMAKERHKYTSILEYYYPGATIIKISELRSSVLTKVERTSTEATVTPHLFSLINLRGVGG